MDLNKKTIWFSFYDRSAYQGTEPFFEETDSYQWVKSIEQNWQDIKSELDYFINTEQLDPYFNTTTVNKKNSWKTISFMSWSAVTNLSLYPKAEKTIKLLSRIPGLVSISFNMLEPGARILPHYGDTNAIHRCHLGLIIPAGLPDCGFKVGTEEKKWEEGKLLMFTDAHYHTAWNNTSQKRYILLFDVIKPEYLAQQKWICATVLASLFLQKRAETFAFLRNTPLVFQAVVLKTLIPFVRIYLPLRNKIYKALHKAK